MLLPESVTAPVPHFVTSPAPLMAPEKVLLSVRSSADAWYRSAGRERGYAEPRKGYVILVSGAGVPRATLHKALLAVHHPSAAELAALLPPAPTAAGTEPVERGDLPPNGDGAPDNSVPSRGL